MGEWVHTCNNLDNGQVIAFGAHTYFNGCKMCHIDIKKTCYVLLSTLILVMDKR
jgi:hypothetical protein